MKKQGGGAAGRKKNDTINSVYPIVDLVTRCNQKCLFCSNLPDNIPSAPDQIKKLLASGADTLRIGLWEPTLSDKLPDLVRFARKSGFEKVLLRTNGVRLSDLAFTRSLLDAGVTTFHVNFPSHLPALSDRITQSKGSYLRRLKGMENIVKLGGEKTMCILMVITTLNYDTMEEYASFVAEKFPGVLNVLFNMVCILGMVPKRLSLVPRFEKVGPHLAAAARVCDKNDIKYIVDDIPICFMKGFEHASIDRYMMLNQKNIQIDKVKPPVCSGCALGGECAGIRPQYLDLYGAGELRPVLKGRAPAAGKKR